MEKESCLNGSTLVSFLAGALVGVGTTLLISAPRGELTQKVRSVVGRREKLTKEQIIEEGVQCAVPEGADICYPE